MNSNLSYELYCYIVLTRLQHGPVPTIPYHTIKSSFLETSASSNDENKLTEAEV